MPALLVTHEADGKATRDYIGNGTKSAPKAFSNGEVPPLGRLRSRGGFAGRSTEIQTHRSIVFRWGLDLTSRLRICAHQLAAVHSFHKRN